MHKQSLDTLNKQLEEISLAITRREEVLTLAKDISLGYTQKTNLGWLLSTCAEEAGTILAVLSGTHAKKWDEIVHKLEEEISLLKVDKKFTEKEVEGFLKQSMQEK